MGQPMKEKKGIRCAGLAVIVFAIVGCDQTQNICKDYYRKQITLPEAAEKLKIEITPLNGDSADRDVAAGGDGIAWGTVQRNIDKYCNYVK